MDHNFTYLYSSKLKVYVVVVTVILSFTRCANFIIMDGHHRAIQAVSIHQYSWSNDGKGNNLVTKFLHAVFKRHFLLRSQYLNATENKPMKILKDEYKTLTIHGTEMYHLSFHDEDNGGPRLFLNKDTISLKLPLTLQPGYDGNNLAYECEVEDSPILPLLRCLGATKLIRVLSAMLCEVRIIFISKHLNTISSCVTSAIAILAQGLLVWRHVSIPVLPPHLFRFLSAGAPYIVGVLEKYAHRIEKVRGMKDVLSINLDDRSLKTYNMEDPKEKVPDLTESSKSSRNPKQYIGSEMLARDLNEVLEVDRKLWGTVAQDFQDAQDIIKSNKRGSLSNISTDSGEKKGKDDFFDAAALFVGTMTGNSPAQDKEVKIEIESELKPNVIRAELVSKATSSRPHTICNNEQAEEMIRASLLSFFLELYGDIGMYLLMSKSTGALKVDKKKFLVRKSQLGVNDTSPMWFVLKQFSRSIMFERFIQGRIEDAEKQAQNKSQILLDHIPLFALCQKHLRKTKSAFTTTEIRRVVFTTIEGCPHHRLVENLEVVRDKTLGLTSDKPFEGDEVSEIKNLINLCKSCNLSCDQVLAVCWMRIGETRPYFWKHNILGLNLLKHFVLHGPFTAVSGAMDGIKDIYSLRYYTNKNVDAARNIQASAMQLFLLLNNIALTFSRRRKALAHSAQEKKEIDESITWSNYLVRRLPLNVGFRHIHVMFSPSGNMIPSSSGSKRSKELKSETAGYDAMPTRKISNSNPSKSSLDLAPSDNGSRRHLHRSAPVRRTHQIIRPL